MPNKNDFSDIAKFLFGCLATICVLIAVLALSLIEINKKFSKEINFIKAKISGFIEQNQ